MLELLQALFSLFLVVHTIKLPLEETQDLSFEISLVSVEKIIKTTVFLLFQRGMESIQLLAILHFHRELT